MTNLRLILNAGRSVWPIPVTVLVLLGSMAQTKPTGPPARQPTSGPATRAATKAPAKIPGIRRIELQKKFIDLEAEVVLREAEWLELFACLPGTREHESILVIRTKPSMIHFALLALGLKPGSPMRWQRQGEEVTVLAPRGARVAVFIVMERDGKVVEIPANEWVRHQTTQKLLPDHIWLFAGSQISLDSKDGKPVFLADINGTTISLVNFGDDLLARPTELTNRNDDAAWGAATENIPKVGTKVIVRLKAVAERPPAGKKSEEEGSEKDEGRGTKDE